MTDKKTKCRIRPEAWTQAMIRRLQKLYPTASWEQLKRSFPGKSRHAIRSKAVKLGIQRNIQETIIAPKLAKQVEFKNDVIDFLKRARTEQEIEFKFGKKGIIELKAITANPPEGLRLQQGRNIFQNITYYLESIPGKLIKPQERIFKLRHSLNDPDYIAIIFPPEAEFSDNEIRIVPLDSVNYGNPTCLLKSFKAHLRYLETTDHSFGFLNGNIFGITTYNKHTAENLRSELRDLLAPVAHKILWAQSGTNEPNLAKVDGIEPLQAVCKELGIFHTQRPVAADIYWKLPSKPIEIYAIHGRSNAVKPGARANLGEIIASTQNFPHFVVLGRLKDGRTGIATARRLDPKQNKIVEHPTFICICPGFEDYRGSVGEKKGAPYPAKGAVALLINADNGHAVSN